jgi:hypothetical protein
VVSDAELKSISTQAFISASSFAERKALLPIRGSDWVFDHIKRLFGTDNADKLDKPTLCASLIYPVFLAMSSLLIG